MAKLAKLKSKWGLLLMLALVIVLVFSLFYFVLPKILFPLRLDSIPSGAYIVPWMRPEPYFETIKSMNSWNIDAVMAEALKLYVNFSITIPNETRTVQSIVYLGHDKEYLYIGGKFYSMGKNPATTVDLTLANYFNLYLDVANNGVLNFPESGSMFSVWVNPEAEQRSATDNWRTGIIWSYDDLVWSYSHSRSEEYVWLTGEYYYQPKAQPASALGSMDALYETSTGTVIILFSRYLWQPATSEINALQIRQGERWVMSFNIELRIFLEYFEDGLFVDGWPMSTFPYSSHDSFWWPKLVIDLTNPPPNL